MVFPKNKGCFCDELSQEDFTIVLALHQEEREARTLLCNGRLLKMTLGFLSRKIFAGKNFRESVQTREKRENLHPAKLTGYTVGLTAQEV